MSHVTFGVFASFVCSVCFIVEAENTEYIRTLEMSDTAEIEETGRRKDRNLYHCNLRTTGCF